MDPTNRSFSRNLTADLIPKHWKLYLIDALHFGLHRQFFLSRRKNVLICDAKKKIEMH